MDVSEGSDQFLTVAVDMTDARTLGGLDDQVNAVQEMSEVRVLRLMCLDLHESSNPDSTHFWS